MKLTTKQLSDIYYDHYNRATGNELIPNCDNPVWAEMTEEINAVIDIETCHELALAQNVAVDTVIEWINDTNNVNVSRQAEYNGMFMKPTPPPLTRAELLRHMLDNEKDGRELHHGIELIDYDKKWCPATYLSNILVKTEDFRIIK